MPSIGEKIRDLRMQRGLTQADLSSDLVTPSMISQIESDRAKPSYTLLVSIANRLGMPVEYFQDDMDEYTGVSPLLGLAEYCLATHRPEEAMLALQQIPTPDSPGKIYQSYHLLMANTMVQQQKYQDASDHLELLRELALRTQDDALLFTVCKHAGHVEYAMDNIAGATHEWKKSVAIGEELRSTGKPASSETEAEMAEIYYLLYKASRELCDDTAKGHYLEQAARLTSNHSRIADIADQFAQDARQALETGDASRARRLIERANAILYAVRQVNQYLHIRAADSATPQHNPLETLGMAAASALPFQFVNAELEVLETATGLRAPDEAMRRLDSCCELLVSSQFATLQTQQEVARLQLRVEITRAELLYNRGETRAAAESLQSALRNLPANMKPTLECVKAYSCLLEWSTGLSESEFVLDAAENLKQCLQSLYPDEADW